MVSKSKRNRLITGRKGAFNEPIPDMWIDYRGIEWLVVDDDTFAKHSILPLALKAMPSLERKGLLEIRFFEIDGRRRRCVRFKFDALNLRLAMPHDE